MSGGLMDVWLDNGLIEVDLMPMSMIKSKLETEVPADGMWLGLKVSVLDLYTGWELCLIKEHCLS